MGEDEARMLAALTELRDKLLEPVVIDRGGTVIKRMGDGWIIEFPNVLDAVASAVEVQEGLSTHDIVRLRVGVHIGDVSFRDDDIFGDGINVAARLEALAKPGQVLISDTAYNSLDGKAAEKFDGGQAQKLKNITREVGVWHWPASAGLENAQADSADATVSDFLMEIPSVAVLPFEDMTQNSEHAFFADGIAEDIITDLSKISRMRVIARNSSAFYKGKAHNVHSVASDLGVRYVVEGSIRSGGQRLRIAAQLIDTKDGSHVWADRFDRTIDDIFDIQDEITKEIVTALRVTLTDGEEARMLSRGTDNIQAWQLCIRATELFMRFNSADFLEARKLAEQAVKIDPNYTYAWATMGFTYWWDGRLGYTGDSAVKFNKAGEIAKHALSLDENLSWAIGLACMVAGNLGQYEEGVAIARRGFHLYPGNADLRAFLGFALSLSGEYSEAEEHFLAAMALNPFYPNWYRNGLSRALLAIDRFEDAMELAEEILAIEPGFLQAWLQKSYILHQLDRMADAKSALAEVRRVAPDLRLAHIRGLIKSNDKEFMTRFVDSIAQVGLPE
jgi:adenylate cyclase